MIVAHAALVALAERDDVLLVLVTASPETRRRRLAEAHRLDEKESAKALGQADAGRADYLERFHGIGTELPTHYDPRAQRRPHRARTRGRADRGRDPLTAFGGPITLSRVPSRSCAASVLAAR